MECFGQILEAFRPGVTNRLGVGYEAVFKVNPKIVYASISAFGQYGPEVSRPAHDIAIEAMAGAAGSALGRLPFSLAERGYVAAARRGRPLQTPPVFLLGHWRSGTTHLYNVLAKGPFGFVDPLAAGLPWDCLLLARWLRPLLLRMLPEGRFIDQVAVGPDSPQEDETAIANMTRLSYFHAIYFPARFRALFRRGLFLEGAAPGAALVATTALFALLHVQYLQADAAMMATFIGLVVGSVGLGFRPARSLP